MVSELLGKILNAGANRVLILVVEDGLRDSNHYFI